MNRREFTSSRKLDHLRICLDENIETGTTGFEEIRLVHEALPDSDMDSLSLKTRFLGHDLGSPLFISAMTGGHPETKEVNAVLGEIAGELGLGIGVGSQRAAIENPDLADTFSIVREKAPNTFIVGNLGIVQLRDHGIEWAEQAVEMIDADALAIHLNFLQESIQPEGDHDAGGCQAALRELCGELKVPVIVKETGSGISYETGIRCYGAGAACIDIGGYGGSSWALIESHRSGSVAGREDQYLKGLGERFGEWGLPTAVSLYEVTRCGGPVIASGGLRSGIDVAKALAMGAGLTGMALPLLKPAFEGPDTLRETIRIIHQELRISMFLTGKSRISELPQARWYLTGKTREMIENLQGGDRIGH
ncbi:type 2 isopentenyl-diphosphate Delta-isomerase [Methanospirillum sp. J.3.6.1-F.2.7.3]|uniref:Isopentenyl-diphosphate delta-isomerase n=1 Tax=Methanospirillum purgamenti TaxID=2834276 RepID=A0A8E7AXY5_9EURY|nr:MULTISPECIES: type 2 isopentenyl-diphosphate Delta-isomerase [Methanospirillum]MDX8549281.1 type 2 isopentenyl-diphosphate Delta-isomerase [Methanospirillum hungatei]QVV89420.1 type 2 isopentenyl-diphosphate Delta-isomerase [Methanospirillum sp. J.3.6.1-F.2.7.3]